MNIIDCRIHDLEDRSPENWVLATTDSKLYIAMKKGIIDLQDLKRMDPSTWTDQLRCIPAMRLHPGKLWPRARSAYRRFQLRDGESPSAVYKKTRDPLDIACSSSRGLEKITEDDIHKRITEREIIACEYIRRFATHPNIAEYRGVVCKSGLTCRSSSGELRADFDTERVTNIVFKRYSSSLLDWVLSGKPVDIKYCLSSIADGIKHLHSIGLVHCDIKPDNIFVDDTGRHCEYVVGDFDSAAQTGTVFELKGGDLTWAKPKRLRINRVKEDDDWYAFDSTKLWLVKQLGARMSDYAHLGGNA